MPDQETGTVAVLIPAAGQGTRLGGHRKQFRRLGGEPLLVQTLRVFERHAEIDHLLVGYDFLFEAYEEAMKHDYGLFSFGDAMLIL